MHALRRAQLWLRDLSAAELYAYLDDHPHLRAVFENARNEGSLPGEFDSDPPTPPYQAEVFWAAFVAYGA